MVNKWEEGTCICQNYLPNRFIDGTVPPGIRDVRVKYLLANNYLIFIHVNKCGV